MGLGTTRERLAYLDGLRGIAVLLVLVHHALRYLVLMVPNHGGVPHLLWQSATYWGDQGVALFLVLSGFCLSIGPLKRRALGESEWFSPREFFARRCLRILPPYYAALGACLILLALCQELKWPAFGSDNGYGLGPGDIISHILLIHNLLGHTYAVNVPFWSLALEWQWYWIFPLVLVGIVAKPRLTLSVCVALMLSWILGVVTFALAGHGHVPELFQVAQARAMLPMRLFEFACGVAAARFAVAARPARSGRLPLALVGLVLFVGTLAIWPVTVDYQMNGLLAGGAFALVVVIAATSPCAARALAPPSLVRLGIVSYSVYLAHNPALQAVEHLLVGRAPVIVVVSGGIVAGLAAGIVLHLTVERWSMRRSTWDSWGPMLTRRLAWTDPLYVRRINRARVKQPQGQPTPRSILPNSALWSVSVVD
ncbi:MAG TPA: acyltransferase [Chloroflexota bacterium]|nr:acyltransferase [Chloroflexota bacterium]